VKISETDNHQQKPTENPRLSPLFFVDDCWYLAIELAQKKHKTASPLSCRHHRQAGAEEVFIFACLAAKVWTVVRMKADWKRIFAFERLW
jgi:hypothetical protein